MDYLRANLNELCFEIEKATRSVLSQSANNLQSAWQREPLRLSRTLAHLINVLESVEEHMLSGRKLLTSDEISELGLHGVTLLERLANCAQILRLDDVEQELNALLLPFSLWIVRHGGEVTAAEPLAERLASWANHTDKREELRSLGYAMGEIIAGIAAVLDRHPYRLDLRQAWQTLSFNRGIVATRSHDTELMQLAFEYLLEQSPELALELLSQGAVQIKQSNYPASVERMVHHYLQLSVTRNTIH